MKLTDFKALTFDCYGTLIDWESGMVAGLKPLTDRVANLSRNDILEAHARHESRQQRWTPAMTYSEILSIVYKRLAEEWAVDVSWEECQVYGASVPNWPAFPDSAEALARLKKHYKLVILSNVDNSSFAGSNKRLDVQFDAIYTAQDVGSYKPANRNFDYMLDALASIDVAKEQVLHTAESLFHDHGPANRFGLANCWIYRRHADEGFGATMDPRADPEAGDVVKSGNTRPTTDFVFHSMKEFADAVDEAFAS